VNNRCRATPLLVNRAKLLLVNRAKLLPVNRAKRPLVNRAKRPLVNRAKHLPVIRPDKQHSLHLRFPPMMVLSQRIRCKRLQ
jgi:hypothetical protein